MLEKIVKLDYFLRGQMEHFKLTNRNSGYLQDLEHRYSESVISQYRRLGSLEHYGDSIEWFGRYLGFARKK